jgi:hypothetical protein
MKKIIPVKKDDYCAIIKKLFLVTVEFTGIAVVTSQILRCHDTPKSGDFP